MTTPAAAPFLAATALLGVAGIAKLVRPTDTAGALRAAGLTPLSRALRLRLAFLVRLGAVGEVAVALSAVIWPGPVTGSLVAAAYAAFALFVVAALVRGWPIASCGCFGRPDTKPGVAHVALNAGAAVAAAWWATNAPSRLGHFLSGQPWSGVPLIFVSVVIAGLALAVWTDPLARVRTSA